MAVVYLGYQEYRYGEMTPATLDYLAQRWKRFGITGITTGDDVAPRRPIPVVAYGASGIFDSSLVDPPPHPLDLLRKRGKRFGRRKPRRNASSRPRPAYVLVGEV